MKKNKEGLFPDLDYKKLKVVDPERKPKFQAIQLVHFIIVIILLGSAIAFFSQSNRQKRRPPPTARDFFIPPPGMEQPVDPSYERPREQRGTSLSY